MDPRLLNELADSGTLGFVLQEAALEVEPKLMSDNGRVARFGAALQDSNDNRNRRNYPERVLREGFASPAVREKLRTGTMYGEANHPFSDDLKRQMSIDQTRISHVVKAVDISGGLVRGVIETASTNCGRDMRGLIVDNKSRVAFSFRGVGKVLREGASDIITVGAPLHVVTYDWVVFPSHPVAYMDAAPASLTEESHIAGFTQDAISSFLQEQSHNVRALVEQMEIEDAHVTLSEDQHCAIIRSDRMAVTAFLERDVRAEFRGLIL